MWWLGEFKTSVSSSLDTSWILDLDVTFGGPWAFRWPTFGAGTPPPHTHTQRDRNGGMKKASYLKKANLHSTEAKQRRLPPFGAQGIPRIRIIPHPCLPKAAPPSPLEMLISSMGWIN